MILNTATRYYSNKPTQFVNRVIHEWAEAMITRAHMLHSLKLVTNTITQPNKKFLWKHGYNYIGYNKAYYRWRRAVHNYYTHNK